MDLFARRSLSFGNPALPTLFLGDVLTRTSVIYCALDICSAFYADLFDLNYHQLEEQYHGTFDIVLNFGTTEHLINQYNAFKIMHDACRVGGIMISQVPTLGYQDHGYFLYDANLFFDISQANNYEIIAMFDDYQIDSINMRQLSVNPSSSDDMQLLNESNGFLYQEYRNHERPLHAKDVCMTVIMKKHMTNQFILSPEVRTAGALYMKDQVYTSKYISSNSLWRKFRNRSRSHAAAAIRNIRRIMGIH